MQVDFSIFVYCKIAQAAGKLSVQYWVLEE